MVGRDNRSFKLWFVLGIIVLAPTYIFSTASHPWFRLPPKPIGDGMCYECIGFSLFQGNGFRENYSDPAWRSAFENDPAYEDFLFRSGERDIPGTGRPPLLPLIIAAVYAICGRNVLGYVTIRILAAICLALAGAMAAGLAAQMLSHRTKRKMIVGLGATVTIGLAASTRTLKDYTGDFLTEPLALLLAQSLIVLVVLRCEKCNFSARGHHVDSCTMPANRIWAVTVGIVMGLMILARSMFVFWIPGLLVLMAVTSGSAVTNWRREVLLAGVTVLLVCAPWWIHNSISLKRIMPLGTQGPLALLGGYSHEAYNDGGNWSPIPESLLRARLAGSSDFRGLENDTDRELFVVDAAKRDLLEWVINNWRMLPSLAVKRAVSHWNPYWGRAAIWKLLIVAGLIWAYFFAAPTRWWLLGLPAISTLVVMTLYETGGRFLVPLYGLLFTLGGLGVSGWWARGQD